MKKYTVYIGHLAHINCNVLESWKLYSFFNTIEAENKKQAKKKIKKDLKKKNTKTDKFILLGIEEVLKRMS